MKIPFYILFFSFLLSSYPAYSQSLITFDNQNWSSNQTIDTIFTADNFSFSSNKSFYTNYGYNFDVNHISLYYAFQNPVSDQITITTLNNALVNLSSLAAYQVSETGIDTLIIEGWDGTDKKYSSKFSNNSAWEILTLDYNSINKIIIKSGNSSNAGLFDYNFDNFSFNSTTDIEPINNAPQSYNLSQNYPNPFNPSTIINWQSPIAGWQNLKVYDILGNEVATLVDEEKVAGSYSVSFDAGNLASGLYIYKLTVGPSSSSQNGQAGQGFVSTKKMMLIK
jgi:hypothetical protein